MTTRVYQKVRRTPKQAAELKALRAHYQKTRPTLEQALAASGQAEPVPLGEVIALHGLLQQLRAVRVGMKVTLAEMERRTGIKQPALSRLETGKAGNPTVGTVMKLAAALGKRVTCHLEDAPRVLSAKAGRKPGRPRGTVGAG